MSKKLELDLLREETCKCTKCPELVESRDKVVFGEGDLNAELMLIGESPGTTENIKGIPFCGEAGELLDSIIKACGWRREDLFICNTIKCHPPSNRNPTDEESRNCRAFLDKQIDIIKPKYLLLLGSVASKALLGEYISSSRGRWYEYKGIPTIATFHPAFLLRNPEQKKEMGKDLRMLLAKMKS